MIERDITRTIMSLNTFDSVEAYFNRPNLICNEQARGDDPLPIKVYIVSASYEIIFMNA
jgi:hypothetical protein